MLRAEQLALIQEANQQLLAIRAAEMDYYVEAFSSFGTQAALIAGFTLDALIGLDVRNYSIDEAWKAVFWISASVSMAASLHCILTTTFANIYGPNLALRGPSGSMVRAVKGMIAEKTGIFSSFTIALFAFQCMTLATTWIVMKFYGACSCTILLLAGGIYWYNYCLRIYNRFKFVEPDIEWRNSDVENSEMDTTDPSARRTRGTSFGGSENSDNSEGANTDSKPFRSILTKVNSVVESPGERGDELSPVDRRTQPPSSRSGGAGVIMEGYLSKMGVHRIGFVSKSEWNRRFFVLQGSNILYYKSREDYQADPSRSIKNRPISVAGCA